MGSCPSLMQYSVEKICSEQADQFVGLAVEHSLAYMADPAATTKAFAQHQLGSNIEMLYLLFMATEIQLADADMPVPAPQLP